MKFFYIKYLEEKKLSPLIIILLSLLRPSSIKIT